MTIFGGYDDGMSLLAATTVLQFSEWCGVCGVCLNEGGEEGECESERVGEGEV